MQCDAASDVALMRKLRDAKLVEPGKLGVGPLPLSAFASPCDALDESEPNTALWRAPGLFWSACRAKRLLTRQPLHVVIAGRRERCARWRAGGKRSETRRVRDLSASFREGRPFAARGGACLQDALSLLLFLGAHGVDVRWVFGVKGAPFSAHCWIEYEGCVLNDTLANARLYAPIMVV